MKEQERGLFIIKPDAIRMGEYLPAFRKIYFKGLDIEEEVRFCFTPESVQQFYTDKQNHLSQYLEGYLCTKPSIAFIVVGEKCISRLEEIRDSLRQEYQHDNFYTGTHSSDSEEAAEREIGIIRQLKKNEGLALSAC